EARLNTFDGRPVYRFRVGRDEAIAYADNGDEHASVTPDMMRRIAARWTGQRADTATVESDIGVDQWTLQTPFSTLGPLWKYSWPDGEQVYVARLSGDVVQYTTTALRVGAYLGPIPHWLYFTPLRRHHRRWTAFVAWMSAIGTLGAFLGLVIGVWTYSPANRYRRDGKPTSIPYRG